MGNIKRKRRKSDVGGDEYQVGYGKPPKHTRFKPGRSGNPKGRPKGVRNFKSDVKKALGAAVRITREGRAHRVSTQEAALLRLLEKALGGDMRALDKLLTLAGVYNNEDSPEVLRLSSDDAELLELYNGRVLRGAAAMPTPARHSSGSPSQMEATTSATSSEAPPIRRRKVRRIRRFQP